MKIQSLLLISLFKGLKFRNPAAAGQKMKLQTCKAPTFVLIILILFPHHGISSQPQNSILWKGSSLSVESETTDLLVSPDKTFTCGFYGLGQNAYWFSIWFTNSAERTVFWTANRERPVNAKGSKLSFRLNSALALTDVDGFLVWETNTTSTDASQAELLNTGNLVLKNPQGKILWQSFDSPTDTLLPTQILGKRSKLVSNLGRGNYGSGYYSFFFDNDNVLRMIYDGPDVSSIYWPTPGLGVFQNGRTSYNSSRIAGFDEMGSFVSSDRLFFSASDFGHGIKRRLTVDTDGNLRLYSLNNSTGSWVISWQAIRNLCRVHGICGRNGICLYTPVPKCSCPPGYQVTDPKDWSKGCKPLFDKKECLERNQVKFVKVPYVDFWGFDLNYNPQASTSMETCRDLCLNECQCNAFSYRLTGEASCYTKSILFNGYQSTSFEGEIYLKLPVSVDVEASASRPPILNGSDIMCEDVESTVMIGSPSMYDIDTKKVRWVYLYSFAGAAGVIEILLIAVGWWFLTAMLTMPDSVETGYHAIASQFRRFSYAELKKATRNFKEELGRGGSGVVYKGVLGDERVVAVKRLGDSYQGEDVFWAEVTTIGKINHMNLVRMWGFCAENRHRILVYEYLKHQSLDNYLFSGTNSLEWQVRFKVALGTAKGLAYLHHECLEWVIHCDVKPENILLDDNFEPKIADFGLAKLSRRDNKSSKFTKIRGTKGYMAPEWASNLPITAKVDVYSYGVVILELVKGIRLSNMVEEEEEEETELARFIRISKIMPGEESWVDEKIVDPKLKGKFNHKQAAKMVEIGLSCIDEDRNKRPTMDSVVQSLLDCQDYRPT